MTTEELQYLIRVNDRDLKELKSNIGSVNKALDKDTAKAATASSGHMQRWGSAVKGAAFLAGGALTFLAAGGIKEAFDGAEQLQKAHDSLAVAIEHTGGDVSKLMPKYDATAKSAAQYGVNVADATQALARATTLTGNAADAQRAYEEALVISKATGKDFNAVLTATAKGQEGVTTSLQRYGIMIPKGTSGTKQYADVMARFGGQAKANTSSIDVLRANVENLGIKLAGPLLRGLELVSGWLVTVMGWIQKNSDTIKPLVFIVGAAAAAWGVYVGITEGIPALVAASTAAIEGLNATMAANPIGVVIVLLAALVAAFIVAYKHSQTFRDIVNGVWASVKGAATSFVDFFTKTIPGAFRDVKEWVAKHWPEIAVLVSGPFAPLVALATNAFGVRDALLGAFHDVRHFLSNVWTDVKNLVRAPFDDIAGAASNGFGIPDRVRGAYSGLKGWLSNTFSTIGNALEGVLKSPVNVIIGALDALDFHFGGVHIPWPVDKTIGSFDWHPFHIPMLAAGGIVTAPTLAMIGEAGPEAIIPLPAGGRLPPPPTVADSFGQRGGDAPIVNVEHMTVSDPGDAQLVASAVNRALAFRR